MIDLLALIILCTVFAYYVQIRTAPYPSVRFGIKKDLQSKVIFWGILVAFILFAGLRSKYNDTSTYMHGFSIIETNDLSWKSFSEPYGGFDTYQKLIKLYISDNPQVFIFLSSVLTNLLYLVFLTRHTSKYAETVFLYAIGSFTFGMAGIKQAIAVGISLYAIEAYLNKKYIRAILILLLAMTFHPYVICLICVPLLKGRIWSVRTVAVIAVCIIAFYNMETVFKLFSLIGRDYSETSFDDYTINPIRVMVESVPIIISVIYRDKLNRSNNKLLCLGINMRIISFVFIAMGLFVNPIYLGRMATYFGCLSAIAIPEMLSICWGKNKGDRIFKWGYYVFFFAYFLMDMTKIGSISIFYDQFRHVPFSSLF